MDIDGYIQKILFAWFHQGIKPKSSAPSTRLKSQNNDLTVYSINCPQWEIPPCFSIEWRKQFKCVYQSSLFTKIFVAEQSETIFSLSEVGWHLSALTTLIIFYYITTDIIYCKVFFLKCNVLDNVKHTYKQTLNWCYQWKIWYFKLYSERCCFWFFVLEN